MFMHVPEIAVEQEAKLIYLWLSFALVFTINFAFWLLFVDSELNFDMIVIILSGDDGGTACIKGEFFIDSVKILNEGFRFEVGLDGDDNIVTHELSPTEPEYNELVGG